MIKTNIMKLLEIFKQPKPIMTIKYKNLQSQSGFLCITNSSLPFLKIEISGNRLVVYGSDNDYTKSDYDEDHAYDP